MSGGEAKGLLVVDAYQGGYACALTDVLNPGVTPIGAPGSTQRRAWDLGRRLRDAEAAAASLRHDLIRSTIDHQRERADRQRAEEERDALRAQVEAMRVPAQYPCIVVCPRCNCRVPA